MAGARRLLLDTEADMRGAADTRGAADIGGTGDTRVAVFIGEER